MMACRATLWYSKWMTDNSDPREEQEFLACHKENLYAPPCFLQSNDCSSLWSGLQSALSEFDWKSIQEMAKEVQLLVLSLGGDLAAANVRMKHFVGMLVKEFNAARAGEGVGQILLIDICCGNHVLHRVAEATFKREKLINKLHATAFVCNQTKHFDRVLRTLKVVVERDLEVGFYVGVRPPPGCEAHSQRILDVTLFRCKATRGETMQSRRRRTRR